MIKIFLETGKKTTQEYVFIKTLLVTKLNKPSSDYELITVGGWNALPQVVNAFKSNTLENGENLIVFDADFAENGGGYEVRRQALEAEITRLGIYAELFLFPNNHDDGDLETLLETIAQKEKHTRFFDCFGDYENCLGTEYQTPNRKGKLFTYISSMKSLTMAQRHKLGQGEWCFDNDEYWDLDSEELKPLKDFLNK